MKTEEIALRRVINECAKRLADGELDLMIKRNGYRELTASLERRKEEGDDTLSNLSIKQEQLYIEKQKIEVALSRIMLEKYAYQLKKIQDTVDGQAGETSASDFYDGRKGKVHSFYD